MSKYAKIVYKLLQYAYPGNRIKKEVPVAKFVKGYMLPESIENKMMLESANLNRMRIDFVVAGICFEVQGEQHEKEIKFSNEILDTAEALRRRKALDTIKQDVLASVGVPLCCIWYNEIKELTIERLREKINACELVAQENTKQKAKKAPSLPGKPKRTGISPAWRNSSESRLKTQYRWFKEQQDGKD